MRVHLGARLSSDLGGWGGMVGLYAGAATERFIFSGGLHLMGGGAPGASARVAFLPLSFGGRVRPMVAAEALAFFPDTLLTGLGVSAGLELQPRPGMAVTLEVPLVALLNPAPGQRAWIPFLSAGVHLLP